MAQIKAQSINWLDRAWQLAAVIGEMPDWPDLGLLRATPSGLPGLTELQTDVLENLQDEIGLHMAYRITVAHKLRVPQFKGKAGFFHVAYRAPEKLIQAYAFLQANGVKFDNAESHAIDAQARLGRILNDRYVCPEWKRDLPLIVASIGGKSVTQVAKQNSEQPRTRPLNLLQQGLIAELTRDRALTWKQILINLQQDGCVISWEAHTKEIHWIDESGCPKQTKISTFQGWRSTLILD